MKHSHRNGSFGSRFGFVLACVGSAVGMGNIWLFPYRIGQYGGAAFLIPFLGLLACLLSLRLGGVQARAHLVLTAIAGIRTGWDAWVVCWAGFR